MALSSVKAPLGGVDHAIQNQLQSDIGSPEQLHQAFENFTQMSEQLASSYHALEEKVSELTGQLHSVHRERDAEVKAKQKVSERLESLLHILPGGVVVLDNRGIVRECNPAAVDILGEPLLGQRWLDVINRSFAPRSDDGHEISTHDGRRISLATSSLDGGNGQIILLTDQTETRKLQQRLSRHERLSAMGKMMSSLAHQIRTPLSAAILYTGHLCSGELQPEQSKKFSEKVMARLKHLEQQVRDMLIFARGDIKMVDRVSVGDLLLDIIAAAELPLRSCGARFNVDCGDAERQAVLLCNQQTMVGAIGNLVNNALQAVANDKSIETADISLRVRLQGENELEIAVVDNGPGFDAQALAGIEEAFFTTKTNGTGLGLSVVRAVARAHQGNFFVHNNDSTGATVGVRLPLFGSESASMDEDPKSVLPTQQIHFSAANGITMGVENHESN